MTGSDTGNSEKNGHITISYDMQKAPESEANGFSGAFLNLSN